MTLRPLHPKTRQDMVLTDEMRDQVIAVWDESFPKIGFVQEGNQLAAGTPGRALTLSVFLQSGPDKMLLRFIFTNQGNSQFCDIDFCAPDWDQLRAWVRDLRERLDNTILDMQSWFVTEDPTVDDRTVDVDSYIDNTGYSMCLNLDTNLVTISWSSLDLKDTSKGTAIVLWDDKEGLKESACLDEAILERLSKVLWSELSR